MNFIGIDYTLFHLDFTPSTRTYLDVVGNSRMPAHTVVAKLHLSAFRLYCCAYQPRYSRPAVFLFIPYCTATALILTIESNLYRSTNFPIWFVWTQFEMQVPTQLNFSRFKIFQKLFLFLSLSGRLGIKINR